MSSRRRVLSLLAVVVAVVALVILLRPRRAPESRPPAEVAEAPPPSSSPSHDPPRAPSLTQVVAESPTVERLKAEYEAYKVSSIYPEWSYPLTRDQEFLLEWNAPVTNDLPVDDRGNIMFRFDAEKARVFAGEPYVSWAEAWTMTNGKKRNLPIQFEKASVVLTSGPKMGDAFALEFRDDGAAPDAQAGDLRYTNRFVPSEHAELRQASSARIEVYVEIAGQKRRFLRDFTWAPRDVLKVLGEHDAVEDGSLVATLDCEVLEDGLYTVYGNLFAADGQTPLAMSKRSYPLTAGRNSVKLVFFGKVLNDQAVDGPYVIKDLHGFKRQGDGEHNNVWWSHPASYTTRAYASDDFSGEEWNDPERKERLATFQRVIAEMQQAPRP